jgi:hypothetical protein
MSDIQKYRNHMRKLRRYFIDTHYSDSSHWIENFLACSLQKQAALLDDISSALNAGDPTRFGPDFPKNVIALRKAILIYLAEKRDGPGQGLIKKLSLA